jgi:two-component system sensor histidine kinase AlgZ
MGTDVSTRFRTVLVIVAGWLVVALAYTPPTIFVQQFSAGAPLINSPWAVLFDIVCGFTPWMAATPFLFALGRRFPIAQGRIGRAVAIHAAIGLVAVPALTFLGSLLGYVLTASQLGLHGFDMARVLGAAAITSFYSVPTYIGVVAIGQALAYFARVQARDRLLARAELRALEAQLNPHFLFNTLNAISTLGYKDPARADQALTQLAAMLRVSLKERPQEIALKDEIAFLKDYIELNDMLLPGRAEFHFAIEPEAWTARVPTMLLQPLVENAITHGVARIAEGGTVTIAARQLDDQLIVSVRNPVPETNVPSSGAGIGLTNACERLRVLYGEAAALDFTRDAKEASVVVALPFREAEP